MGLTKLSTALPPCEKKPLKIIEKEYFLSATTHGLGRIYGATNYFARVFWIIAFLTMFSSLTYTVTGIVRKIYANEIVTVSRATSKMAMDFPAVTVCHANPFRKTAMEKLLATYAPNAINASDETQMLTVSHLLSKMNNSELYEMGYSFDQFLLSKPAITFNNINYSQLSNFHVTTTSIQGNCYTFNYNGTLKQERAGYFWGLSISLNVHQHEDHVIGLKGQYIVGALVTVHQPGMPATVMSSNILAAPGQLTRILVRHEHVDRLPNPYPDRCNPSANRVLGDLRYNVNLCYLKCYADKQFQLCGVVEPLVPSYLMSVFGTLGEIANYAVASTTDEYNCTIEFEEKYTKAEIHCSCPAVCEEDIYRTTVSSAKWPSKPYAAKLLKGLKQSSNHFDTWTLETVSENLLSIQVFFDDFSTYETEQKPAYDGSSFVSDLGGQLGLWIGASIFSVLELAAFFIEIFVHKMYYSKNNKVQKQTGWT